MQWRGNTKHKAAQRAGRARAPFSDYRLRIATLVAEWLRQGTDNVAKRPASSVAEVPTRHIVAVSRTAQPASRATLARTLAQARARPPDGLPKFVASSPTAAPGQRTCQVPRSAIRSAGGSTATAAMTPLKSGLATSLVPASTTQTALRSTRTTRLSSRSASASTRTIATSCATRLRRSTTRSRVRGRSRGPISATAILNRAGMSVRCPVSMS
jgi:hypothetical protein